MTIGKEDMLRLIAEMAVNDKSAEDWIEEVGLDPEVIVELIEKMKSAMVVCVVGGMDVQDALAAMVGTSFQVGWETHKQYGRQ